MGMGDPQRRRRGTAHQLSRKALTTNSQTSKNWTGPSPRKRLRVTQAPMTAVWSFQGLRGSHGNLFRGVQTEDSVCGSLSLWNWLTQATVTSTATQTLEDGRSLQQWRSIQGQHWLDLQKVQHTPSLPSACGGTLGAPRQRCWNRMQGAFKMSLRHVDPEQELWGRNCALLLGACAEGRRRKGAGRGATG